MAEFFSSQSDPIIVCPKITHQDAPDSTIDSPPRDGKTSEETQIELVNKAAD